MMLNEKKVHFNFVLSIISFIELILAGIITLTVSPDPKNAWFLGFSKQRWALVLFTFFLAIIFLIICGIAKFHKTTIKDFLLKRASGSWYRVIEFVAYILILWGLCSIFCPPYLFAKWANYYERIRPLSIAFGLILFQFVLLSLVLDKKERFYDLTLFDRKKPFFRASIFFVVCLFLLFGFIGITKIGLVKDTHYWNVVGIPITGLQFFAIMITISLGIYYSPTTEQTLQSRGISRITRFLPVIIFLSTVLVWGLTPMLKHVNSLMQTPLNMQPFPWKDARWLDLGGLSILKGYGINFPIPSDKPLYMVFLATLHLIAGNNYSLISWLQILVLSFTPVVLFLFGKEYYSQSFGFFLALIMIFRQRNAIVLSNEISSVNPKLLLSEPMTLLGIVLFTYLVFLWLRYQKPWLALLAGGVLGATTLIRMNPILLFPVIGFIALVSMWKFPKTKWRLLTLYTLGFLIVMTPWLILNVDQNGRSLALEKIKYVLFTRYQTIPQATQRPPGLPLVLEMPNSNQKETIVNNIPIIDQQFSFLSFSHQFLSLHPNNLFDSKKVSNFLDLFSNHFLHNIVTSALALPNSHVYEDLDTNRLRPYWIEGSGWQGDLQPSQIFLILFNIILIAIGLGFSWSRFRWAGLVPLFIFLGYDMALAIAMNSGGRYIVSIDWIMYFYYGLSLVYIIRWVNNIFRGKNQIISVEVDSQKYEDFENKKRFWQSLAALIMIASLIPIANNVMPMLKNQSNLSDNTELFINSIPEAQKIGSEILIGELLYPSYEYDSSFKFDLLTNENVSSYSILLDPQPLKMTLLGGEKILIGNNAGNLDFIYLISGSSLNLIWERNSSK